MFKVWKSCGDLSICLLPQNKTIRSLQNSDKNHTLQNLVKEQLINVVTWDVMLSAATFILGRFIEHTSLCNYSDFKRERNWGADGAANLQKIESVTNRLIYYLRNWLPYRRSDWLDTDWLST